MKKCTRCKEQKEYSQFHKSSDRKDGLSYRCKDCTREYNRESWNRNNRAKAVRDKRKRYGISAELYAEMLSKGCEVCGSTGKLVIDHDHSCCSGIITCGKCVRGMLCYRCNTAEGLLLSNPELAKALAEYMTRMVK